ncbi:MAG: DUF4899 domain-containing protein [Thermotogaceae bacterium]|nr:DUF4899 domain-containing protein [Thermotogaceae bacterium]
MRVRSKATAEDLMGYLFGRAATEPQYDFIVVPARYANAINIPLDLEYKDFMERFKKTRDKVLNEIPEAVELTDNFLNMVRLYIGKKGREVFSAELAAAVEREDGDLLHAALEELMRNWSNRIEMKISFKSMTLEELSVENFLSQMEDISEENIIEVLKRPDVKDTPEIFPIIDPIYGKSITEFDIGDKIFFVVLNPGSEEYRKKLETSFPSNFKNGETVQPFVGTLISKELIVGKRGGRYLLIKVDMGKGVIGKGIVSPSLKIMEDVERYAEKYTASSSDEELFKKVGRVAKEVLKETPSSNVKRVRKTKVSTSTVYTKSTGVDFFIALLATLLVIGLILIISYYFF